MKVVLFNTGIFMKFIFSFSLFSILIESVLFPPLANACDLCAVYSATSAVGQGGMGVNVGIAEQFTHFGSLRNDGHEVANGFHQFLDSSITQLFSSYDFTPQW